MTRGGRISAMTITTLKLTDFSSQALTAAIKGNLYTFFGSLGRSPHAQVFQSDQLRRWHTGIAHPWFNGVLSLGAPTPAADQLIVETLEYFRQRSVSAITWWLSPHLSKEGWEALLLGHGFQHEAGVPGMALDLQGFTPPDAPAPDGFQISVVQDENTFRAWVGTFINGYGLPTEFEEPMYNIYLDLGFDLPLRYFLGTYHGKPVATSTLFLAEGVAGVYNIATLPEARRNGLGRAMSLQPLLEAQQLGYRIAILQSSEAGYNVYRKLGFQHICQMEDYYWQEPA